MDDLLDFGHDPEAFDAAVEAAKSKGMAMPTQGLPNYPQTRPRSPASRRPRPPSVFGGGLAPTGGTEKAYHMATASSSRARTARRTRRSSPARS